MTRAPWTAIAAATLTVGLVAACGSSGSGPKALPSATLDRLAARQAQTSVREPAFRLAVATRQGRSEAKTLAALPLSQYKCSATSAAHGVSATYRCIIGSLPAPSQEQREQSDGRQPAEGIANATCNVSTGRCGAWDIWMLSEGVLTVNGGVITT